MQKAKGIGKELKMFEIKMYMACCSCCDCMESKNHCFRLVLNPGDLSHKFYV